MADHRLPSWRREEQEHMFPRLTHVGGRRLSTHIQSFVTPACSKRQLEIRYDEKNFPEWMMDDEKIPEWITPHDQNITTLEQLHRYTIEDLLESSIGKQPTMADFEAEENGRAEWGLRRKSPEDYPLELNKHNFSRVLREIEVRGPDIKLRLGKYKSPIYSCLRRDVPIKSAKAILNCGGGGGR